MALIGVTPLSLFVGYGFLKPLPPRALESAPAPALRAEITALPLIDEALPAPVTVVTSGVVTMGTDLIDVPRPEPTPVDPVPEIARAGGVRTAVALLVTDATAGRRPRAEAMGQALGWALRGGLDEDAEELALRMAGKEADPALDRLIPWVVERLAAREGHESAASYLDRLVSSGWEPSGPLAVCRAIVAGPEIPDISKPPAPLPDAGYWGKILQPGRDASALDELVSAFPDDVLLKMHRARLRSRELPVRDLQPLLDEVLAVSPESILFVKKLQARALRRETREAEALATEREIQQMDTFATTRSW